MELQKVNCANWLFGMYAISYVSTNDKRTSDSDKKQLFNKIFYLSTTRVSMQYHP